MTYTVHPFAECFPLIDGPEFDALVEDIKANGLLDPIVLHRNQVIDGRNRLRACEVAGVPPRYREVNPADVAAYITSTNLHRRHLSVKQRAAIVAEMATLANGTNRYSIKQEVIKEQDSKCLAPPVGGSCRSRRAAPISRLTCGSCTSHAISARA